MSTQFQFPEIHLPDIGVWKLPPAQPVGDPNSDVLYHAVGYTLSTWEGLEWEIAALYSELLGSHSYAAQRSYGLVTTAQVRAKILQEVLDIAATEEQTQNWSGLKWANLVLKHYVKASELRNAVAHGLVAGLAAEPGKPLTFYLVPAGYNTRQTTPRHALPPGKKRTGLGDIKSFGARYALTAGQIHALRQNLVFLSVAGSQVVNSLRQHWIDRKKAGQATDAGRIIMTVNHVRK